MLMPTEILCAPHTDTISNRMFHGGVSYGMVKENGQTYLAMDVAFDTKLDDVKLQGRCLRTLTFVRRDILKETGIIEPRTRPHIHETHEHDEVFISYSYKIPLPEHADACSLMEKLQESLLNRTLDSLANYGALTVRPACNGNNGKHR